MQNQNQDQDQYPPRNRIAAAFMRIRRAFGYSLAGLAAALRHEAAFREEALCALVLVPLAFFLTANPLQRALMVGAVMLILIVELLNSALEAAVDRISTDIHPLAKQAKDIGSAAVLLSIVNMLVVWAAVLL